MTSATAPYSNREIDIFMKEIKDQLDRIEVQTMKTNGRVSMLERYKTGIVMCIGFATFILIPLGVWTFNVSQQNLEIKILNQIIK